jgi:hypothetical protein
VKIVFLCGSLEKGRDGVGDYCQTVADAFRRLGHDAALLSIHDRFVKSPDVVQSDDSILRLPHDEPWEARHRHATEFLAAQRPDWISLQFVGYALEPSGVVFRWARRLGELLRDHRVHLMFHELWIGASTEYGLADRLVGAAQKDSIRRLVRSVRPSAVHTTSRVYQDLLAGIGVKAGRLILPGNIPLHLDAGKRAGDAPTEVAGFDRERCWLAGVFGTIHARWTPEPWLAELSEQAGKAGRKLVLVQFGEAGSQGKTRWERMAADYRDRAHFAACGPRDPAEIAALLRNMDCGIATSPWALIEKSGSTAAFLDRGLPVLVTRDDWHLRSGCTADPAADPLLFKSASALMRFLRSHPSIQPRSDKLASIANRLAAELLAAQ